MIDYDATLKIFFAEVVKYLEKLQRKAEDNVQHKRIETAIDIVRRIAANPIKYADYNARVKDGMDGGNVGSAFIPVGTNDNSVLLTYFAVVNSMGNLNSKSDWERKKAQQKLLTSLRTLKYKNSTNLLKDLTFAFKSPKSFAVQSTKQY